MFRKTFNETFRSEVRTEITFLVYIITRDPTVAWSAAGGGYFYGKFKMNKIIRRGFETESQSRGKTKKLTDLVTCACLNVVLTVMF